MSHSESVPTSSPDLLTSSSPTIPSMASPMTTSASVYATVDPAPSASSTPTTTKKGVKRKTKSEAKKRKVGEDESVDTSNEIIQLEKTIDFYRSEYNEVLAKLNSAEAKAIDKETDYLRMLAKKEEQIRTQDEMMSKGKEEILRLRANVDELETERDELHQCLMDKEREDKELKEAEEDRKFREKQKEFGDLFNRYRTSPPLKYIKYYSIPSNFSESAASGSLGKYKIPRIQPNLAEKSLRPGGGGHCDHITVNRVEAVTPPSAASRSWEEGPPKPRTKGPRNKLPPYCRKYLNGECSFGDSCKFIHVSEGNLFAYLIYGFPKSTIRRRETKEPSQNQDNSQEHLSVEDQVARAINRILADKNRK